MVGRPLAPEDAARVSTLARATIGAGALAFLIVAFALPVAWTGLARDAWLVAGALAAACYLLHMADVKLPWGAREQLSIELDEIVVFLGFALLPPGLVPFTMLPGLALAQVAKRRPALKGAFNVAVHVGSAAAVALVFVAAAPWTGVLVAAALATLVYSPLTQLLVAPVLARLGGTGVLAVVRTRMVRPIVFQVVLGVCTGVVALALWDFHPVALAALVPFLFVAREFARYHERAERVLVVHARLQALNAALARPESLEAIATRTLDALLDLVGPADAALTLAPRAGGEARTWRRAAPSPLAWHGSRTLVVPIVGRNGAVHGTLRVDAPARRPDMTGPTVHLLAEQAAGAMERL